MATSLLSSRKSRTAYTVLALLVSVSSTALPDHTTRRLRQAKGPGFYGKPLSATPADLFRDPSGRAHLLVSWCRDLCTLHCRCRRTILHWLQICRPMVADFLQAKLGNPPAYHAYYADAL